MESLFIKEGIWEAYAEIIACEDMVDIDTYVDEDLLEDKSVNLDEIKTKHTIA